MGTKSLDSEKPRVERQSRIFRKTEDHERSDVSKKESKHEASKKLESPRISKDLPSPKEQEADKGDELMFNFRQALRRHQVSGEKRTSEERDSSKDVHKSTAEMIEKIRAAKAQIKHLKEAQLQSEDSDVFISKSGGKERRKALSSSSVEETDVSISKSGGKERRKVLSSSSVEETDEKHISKSIPKLARQKLVSDDLKAKYIESKKEEKENEDKVRSSETENVPKKRTHRKQKQKEHIDFWAKPEGETSKVQETEQTKVVQTDRDLYRKALAEKFKKDSSGFEFGTSFASKPKTVESKDEVVEKIAHQKDVEKSSPSYDSVFHDGSDSKLTEQSDQINLADKPVYSLVYQEPSSKSLAPYGVTYASKSTVDNVPSHQNLKDTQSVETEKVKGKIERKTPRQLKKHTKAKTLELGVLSQPVEEKPSLQTSQDDTAVGSNTTTDDLLRKERIEKYKEERKKQLATVFGGGDSELPSLFLSSRTEADATPISRSKSLKVESGSKSDSSQSSVGRSKSMKEESQAQTSKISGLQLAELGSQAKDSYDSHQQRSKTSSQSKDLTDKDSKEITHRTMLAEMVLAEDREHAVKSSFEKETDSGHESTDSSKRIRRQLPSLQDVLGTTVIEKEKTESKQIETYYINDDRRKPIGKMKDTDIKRKPAEFSLDYSKVKVIPKTGPAENSKEQVMPESSKNIGVVIPQRSHNLTESKSDNQVKSEIEGRPVKHVFDHTEKRVVDLEKTSDIESDIPKDSVSKMSKHFMHSKDKGKSDTVMFGSDYRKPKTETDFIGKSIHEVRPVPLIQNLNTQIEPTPMELAVINTISKVPAGDEISKNKDIDKHSDRSSLTPERVISVSEAHKVFSESSHKQDFATEYHQKRKESPAFEKIKASPTAVKDTISSVTKSQNELVGQQSSKNNSLSADLNRSESQRIRKPHHTDSGSETGDYTGMKPPMSPRSEKKRSESKFGKVSYRSTASEDVKTDSQKERERSKSRELSREKEIKRPQDTIKERSPSLESIPKSDIKIRNLKERSPSADTISKAGVTKISYRDLEKSKPDVQRKFDIESKERPASVVFGSDFRKVSKIDSDKKETPGSMLLGSDYRKPKSDADIKDRSAPGMVVGSDYRKPNSDADIKDRSAPGAVVGSDYRKPKYDTGTKDKSESTVFGSDFRKTKIETQHVGKSVPEDRAPSDAVKIVKAEVKETQPPATAVVQPSQAKVDRVAPVVQPSQAKVDRVAPVVQPSQAKVDRVAPVVQPSQAKVDRVAPVVQPSQAKVDRVAPVVKPATISMKTASTIIEKPTYKEEKMGVSEKDTKFSIKDDAVSTASGHVIEVPVSPRQKSPPKIVASVTSKHSVPKSDLNTEVKPTARELQPTESKENVKKTSTQISLERQASEPSETKLVETKSSDVKVKPSSSDKATDQVTMKNKTSEKERSKPVQYVHPTAPLLSFSAKTEAPKTMEVPPTKTIQLPEKKTEIKTEIKSEKQDKGGESNQDYISRRAKEEAWKKPVDTTSEFHKKTVEKMLLDTSLDDILSRNVDYLSDENKESSGSARGRAIKKSRPQSVHEESRSHGRTKRIFKKKNLQRSKSEDRSHFMVEGSGAVRRRSQGTEDISRSREKAKGTDSRSRDNR